ncbi:fungal specific transcription factor [Apiospora aurea]|uniref:Fungal specific transcription factor n=1 Tax=Apiospora aurea TaxID=335848 RepID=A0ABR1Q7S4_9PEZI
MVPQPQQPSPGIAPRLESPSAASSAPKRRRLSATAYSEPITPAATPSTNLPEPREPGYLGPTSFMPVFEEAQSHLLTPSMTDPAVAALADPSDMSASSSTSQPRESEETLKLCLEVLSCIPPRSTSEVLFTRNVNPNDTWLPGGRLRLARSLYEAFGASLEGNRHYSQLREMASILCSNSKARFIEDQDDPEEYMSSFCGTQMRWESLGILFTYWAFSASLTRDTDIDPVGQNVFTGRQMSRRFTNCVSKCIDICRKLGAPPNTLFVYVCFRHMLLESNVSGDASLETWRAHAELVAITTFLGLHCIPRTTPYEPSVSSEIKRRLFACVYNIDKVVSSFTGRPPLLNARHVSTPLPLDIDDEVLLGDRERLLEVARTPEISDERHFYDNKLKSVTIMRARGMMAFIRNDILDISLGQIHGDVAASLSQLRQRELETFAGFPDVLVFRLDELENTTLSSATRYSKLLVRLEHLQNLFFIQRLYAKHGQSDRSELLTISFEMVSLTVYFWTHRDWFRDILGGLRWHLPRLWMLPPRATTTPLAEGDQSHQGPLLSPPNPSSSAADFGSKPPPKRSQIIRQLSLLVGFLEWIRPAAPNSELCQTVARIVRHVLDQTLDGPPRGAGPEDAAVDWGTAEFATDVSNYFNFDLLDTFDWL